MLEIAVYAPPCFNRCIHAHQKLIIDLMIKKLSQKKIILLEIACLQGKLTQF